jgi:hypothetical protein
MARAFNPTSIRASRPETCDRRRPFKSSPIRGAPIPRTTFAEQPARERALSSSSDASRPIGPGETRTARPLKHCKKGSWWLTPAQTDNVTRACHYALRIGLPLNRSVTINWQAGGVQDSVRASGRFLKLTRDWLHRRGSGFAYVWVRESGSRVGEHVHILLHVPAGLARRLSELQRRWLKASGARLVKGLIKSRPVGRSYAASVSGVSDPCYLRNLSVALSYLCKQTEHTQPQWSHRRSAAHSFLRGKRCGVSENLGAQARARPTAGRDGAESLPIDFD